MAKKARKITATFSDGCTIARNTTLALTHAWRWLGEGASFPGNSGFSSSAELAERAMATEQRRFEARGGTVTSAEVVPVAEP